ncbi:MAG: YfhO family protein [Planctomycetales bacterium]
MPAPVSPPQTQRAAGKFPLAVVWVPLLALGLTILFWSPMWEGAGLIGGDLYTYFFPQKKFFVDRLRAGEFPFWNSLIGHGYPLVAESQTGVFYPFHLAYALLDVNSAYNFVQLLHYVLAFVFTWLYARSIKLSSIGAILVGLVYVYGWFPARLCLEWAIIGGAWLPCALWCVEEFFRTRYWRYLILLSVALACQMLPGHFNLAFLTLLTLVVYIPVRLWSPAAAVHFSSRQRTRAAGLIIASLVCAFTLSAVQLLPTWELKRVSQRAGVSEEHDPRYGNLPFWYWRQLVMPWDYARPDLDNLLNAGLPPSASTNKVEAHLYFGLIPVLLLLGMLLSGKVFRDPLLRLWFVLGLLALIYTPGWLVVVTKYLPGFNFFKGPGRFGIITTFAVAVIAGTAFDRFLKMCRRDTAWLVAVLVLALTTLDLWTVSRVTGYATFVPQPILEFIPKSPVREILLASPEPVRLFSRGANLPTLLGVASTPEYLGIGPAEYYAPETMMPRPLPYEEKPTPEQLDWLRRAAVTHILAHKPLEQCGWPADSFKPVWSGLDPFLNRAWGRQEPLYLYQFLGGRSRVSLAQPKPGDSARVVKYHANEISSEVSTSGRQTLILADLNYPGWTVTVDGQSAPAITVEKMYRGVEVPAGKHTVTWSYRPASILWGGILSVVTVLFLAAVGHVRFWHPLKT